MRKEEWARVPTLEEVQAAQEVLRVRQTRAKYYWQAKELVERAMAARDWNGTAEGLLVMLRTWNKSFYRFAGIPRRGPISDKHTADIADLVARYYECLTGFGQRTIASLCDADRPVILRMFRSFELVLGRVGPPKSLHLLAPLFFALWDGKIAKAYGVRLRPIWSGKNGALYCDFMEITRTQFEALGGEQVLGPNALKAIDEYNYVHSNNWS